MYIFDEFFASGKEESISPFLTPTSRKWGKNLSLKSAILSAILLLVAFLCSFFVPDAVLLALVPVYFFSGTPALLNSIEDIKNFEINIDVLMTLAALLSVLIGSALEGALLLVLFELSGAMEESVTHKTKDALVNLHELSPKTARQIEEDGHTVEKSIREVTPGAKLLVRAGEIVPLDSCVIGGNSYVNLKHLTGESEPIPKKTGDEVPAGARNLDGSLTIKVLRASTDSTLNRIIQLITQAQEAKPKLQRLLDRFSKGYAMTIILLSALFALGLPLIISLPYLGHEGSIYRALTFLIAASPCALIIATPTAYLSAISCCAKRGILLKGGVVLDALTRCATVAFDKTGTLTTGDLECTGVDCLLSHGESIPHTTAIAAAAALEQHATHPIGQAICRYARQCQIPSLPIQNFLSHPGLGLEAHVEIGNQRLRAAIGHHTFIVNYLPSPIAAQWEPLLASLQQTQAIRALLLLGESLFLFSCTDTLRSDMAHTVHELQKDHRLQLVMLTGDHLKNAQQVASAVGIQEVYANLRPEDKLARVAELSENGGLIMIGDGVNDAPALARATVGISMGKVGSATAVDASDIVFIRDDLSSLSWLMAKAHQTTRIVKENLFLALAVILLATTPALLGIVPLWLAVILHEGGTVLVGLNSLRLLKTRIT